VLHRDDAAYIEFVAASQQRLRRSAYLMTGDWQAAADVTQEALIRVYVA
jgi:DNA-directed RNA polymerase specialized sigma24 family protein